MKRLFIKNDTKQIFLIPSAGIIRETNYNTRKTEHIRIAFAWITFRIAYRIWNKR